MLKVDADGYVEMVIPNPNKRCYTQAAIADAVDRSHRGVLIAQASQPVLDPEKSHDDYMRRVTAHDFTTAVATIKDLQYRPDTNDFIANVGMLNDHPIQMLEERKFCLRGFMTPFKSPEHDGQVVEIITWDLCTQ